MNQILSVEMPRKGATSKSRNSNKVSTKSVITFFCIVLIILGIALIGIAVFSMVKSTNQTSNTNSSNMPRIDVTQNATELEIEISCESAISSVEYNWENKDPEKVNSNGKNNLSLKVDIPSGNNIFTMKVTDADGKTKEFSKEYVGAKAPNITLFDPTKKYNVIMVKCEENQLIKYMSYNYDEEQETTKEINNKEGTIEVPEKPGEHNLTIRVGYEDGTVGKITNRLYIPSVKIQANGVGSYDKFIINASSPKKINKVKIVFNGQSSEEQVDSETYYKEVDLKPGNPGTNTLLVTVYDEEGMPYTAGVKDTNRKK